MNVSERYVGVILARKGSRRLPGKNRRLLAGAPLYAHTVRAALESGVFARVVLSTDDEEILAGMAAHPEALALPRPAELAGDAVSGWQVCAHLLAAHPELFDGAEGFSLLTPCHPFRTAAHIREAFQRFATVRSDALLTVSPLPFPPERALDLEGPFLRRDWQGLARKDQFAQRYYPNGAVTILRTRFFQATGDIYGQNTLGHALPWPYSLDIDEPEDLALAELLAPCLMGGRP